MAVGKYLVLTGAFILILGLVFLAIEKFTGGHGLPGDIVLRRGGITFIFPIVSMVVVSLILTLILNLLFRK